MDISYDDFRKLDIRIAKVLKVEEIEGADRLYKLTLDVGDSDLGLGERTVVSGIKMYYSPDELVGKLVVYLSNLEPKELRGVVSQGMILAASSGEGAVLLRPFTKVSTGSIVK